MVDLIACKQKEIVMLVTVMLATVLISETSLDQEGGTGRDGEQVERQETEQ